MAALPWRRFLSNGTQSGPQRDRTTDQDGQLYLRCMIVNQMKLFEVLIPGASCPRFRDDIAHHSEMISPGVAGASAGRLRSAPLAVPKERPDASRENDHAPSARSSSVEVRWWRTDP